MANPNPNPATRFTSDNQPANKGRKGSRDKLSQDFLTDLLAVYATDGKAAIEHVARNDQSTFFKAMITLQPKEIEHKGLADALSEDVLDEVIAQAHERIAARKLAQ